MSHSWDSLRLAVALSLGAVLVWTTASAQDNSWIDTSSAGGKWEDGTKWSLGVPPASSQSMLWITNSPNKTVTIDAATTNTPTMTISNLQVSAPLGVTNTLALVNAGLETPLRLNNSLTISVGGALTITNSALLGGAGVPVAVAIDGKLSMIDGSLVATNVGGVNLSVGDFVFSRGQMTVAGGSLSVFQCRVGNSGGAQGTLTMSGGTNLFGLLSVGAIANATGTVWMTGGVLAGNFPAIRVGDAGVGQMVISNGSVQAFTGLMRGPSSTLTMAGGTFDLSSSLQVASDLNSTSAVWITGGQLTVTNATTSIAPNGAGQMIVSNGSFLARDLRVGSGSGNGTLTIAGGTAVLSSNLIMAVGVGRTGTVWITGGKLVATNASTAIGVQGFGRFTVSNGTWLAKDVVLGETFFGQGTLSVLGGTNALVGPLKIGTANGTGTLWVTGGKLVVTNTPGTVGAGAGFFVDGSVTLTNGGSMIVSNVTTIVGHAGSGSLSVSGGSMLVGELIVGNLTGSRGTITFDGGTNRMTSATAIAFDTGSTGTMWIKGGLVNPTDADTFVVGSGGSGQLVLSNGMLRCGQLEIGGDDGSVGTLTVAGGTMDGPAALRAGNVGAPGTVWITGGTVVLTNDSFDTVIGVGGVGRMTVSNGLVFARTLNLGQGAGVGTFTVAGGTNTVNSGMTLGNFGCTATGVVAVTGGCLDVTNATGTATLEVRSGTVQLNSGTLKIDNLVITNACGNFVHTGGMLSITSTNLDPNLSAVGDGIANGWKQQYGLDPFDPNLANEDADGDGMSNLQEFLTNTDPTNNASFFGITAITREGEDIRVTWMTGIGKTNALDRSAGDASGGFTNVFIPIFSVTNTLDTTTNYLDMSTATNVPAFYYRVRLVP